MVEFVCFVVGRVAGVLLQLTKSGAIARYLGDWYGWLRPLAVSVSFVGGYWAANVVRQSFSRISTFLYATVVGLILSSFITPALGMLAGALAGFWVVAFQDRALRALVEVAILIVASFSTGLLARFAWVMLPSFGLLLSALILSLMLWFAIKLGYWLRLPDDRAKKRPMAILVGQLFVLFFAVIGWHLEVPLYSAARFSGFNLARIQDFRTDWLYLGFPVTDLVVRDPNSTDLAHVRSMRHLQGVDLRQLDQDLRLSTLGVIPTAKWIQLEGTTSQQLYEAGEVFPAVTYIQVKSPVDELSLEPEFFPRVAVFSLVDANLCGADFDELQKLAFLRELYLYECKIEKLQLDGPLAQRLTAITMYTCQISKETILELAKLPSLTSFRYFAPSESGETLPDEAVFALAANPSVTSDVRIQVERFNPEVIEALASLSLRAQVEVTSKNDKDFEIKDVLRTEALKLKARKNKNSQASP
ncbi:MAG: hypothetical protein AAF483_15205 [Planctomycetota bacterium]